MVFSRHTLFPIRVRSIRAKPSSSQTVWTKISLLLVISALPSMTVLAQTNSPVSWSANQDHQNMMTQLGIKSLRPGAEGMNQQAANYQNTDEAKANPWPNLPEVLTLKDGEIVSTPETWWQKRRPEIVEDFDREIYGRVPTNVPPVIWKVTSNIHTNNGSIPVITKQLVGHVDNSACPQIDVDIQLTLTTPADAKGQVPVMLEFGFGSFSDFGGRRRFGGTNNLSGHGSPCEHQCISRRRKLRRFKLATALPLERLGLRGDCADKFSSGQRRGANQRHHRPVGGAITASRASRRTGARCARGRGAQVARWIILRPIPPWTRSAWASKACHVMAKPRWSRWLTTSVLPSHSSVRRVRAAQNCTAVTGANWSKI